MGQNRRTQTRHEVSIPSTLTIDNNAQDCTLVNLSLGGAFVLHHKVAMGLMCKLSFVVPTQVETVEAEAIVRWCTEDGVGVQFQGLRAKDVYALGKYFEQLV
ncbi:MAG: PilZ domain-containing protein [Kofleriaceae bacterium]|nr:PilZ domain-containing protein [Kofleriaceae bacterium]